MFSRAIPSLFSLKATDTDDDQKLSCVIKHFRGTVNMLLVLEADNVQVGSGGLMPHLRYM